MDIYIYIYIPLPQVNGFSVHDKSFYANVMNRLPAIKDKITHQTNALHLCFQW